MHHFTQICSGLDVAPILTGLHAHPELWDQHSVRKTAPGTPHSGMSDIWVRYNDVKPFEASGDYRRFNAEHVPIWYPAWTAVPALQPLVMDLMARCRGEMLGGVLITRIPPGGRIEPHTDRGWHVQYFDKFYVSLQSAPGAEFCCDADGVEERLCPEAGDVWLFDNRKLHWVENHSDVDRITLIVCIRTAMFGREP